MSATPPCSTLFPYTTLFRSADTEIETTQAGEDLEHLRDMASEAPVIRLVNAMIAQAVEKRASDHGVDQRSEEHTSELQSRENLVCRLLLEKKKKTANRHMNA